MQNVEIQTIGTYSLQYKLGQGGMAEVYLAVDKRTEQLRAIKLVPSSDREYVERFRREIQAMSELRHEHILPVLDYGKDGSWCYMVTPYIEYGTLDKPLKAGRMEPEEAGTFLEQIASALQYAHSHGVLHRDIKPANVLLKDGHHVYLADFGLAKRKEDSHSLTQTGFLMGTVEYMAPELVEERATSASDIYSLGILLYQMLTGRLPFQSDALLQTIYKHKYAQPEPPSKWNPQLSSTADAVILRAMAKQPQDRYQTPLELVQEYQKALVLVPEVTVNTVLPDTSQDLQLASPFRNNDAQRKWHQDTGARSVILLTAITIFSVLMLAGSLFASTSFAPVSVSHGPGMGRKVSIQSTTAHRAAPAHLPSSGKRNAGSEATPPSSSHPGVQADPAPGNSSIAPQENNGNSTHCILSILCFGP